MGEHLSAERIRADVAEVLLLEPAEVDETADLLNEGLDSIRILTLVERWRDAGAEVSFKQLAEETTLVAWWRVLSAGQAGNDRG